MNAENSRAIAINNLTKTYGKNRGIDDVTFEVTKGEKGGTLYYLWNVHGDCLTLRRTEEGIKILSHTKGL